MRLRWFHRHRWTRWDACLVEDDERYTVVIIEDIHWRMCTECGAQQEKDLACASS
jgi:hypothetical protein